MAGRTSSVPKIERPVSEDRKTNYTKPDKTERSGLITSRVGQGYYRQQVLEKWNGVCAVTGCRIRKILIASHIVPWSESNDHERLDPNNGILLSPDIDALFDRNLISFNEDGTLIRSSAVSAGDLDTLGIPKDATVRIDAGMEKYLKRHRAQLA
jgi:5-methylcytosine-specific restriction enzyme A